MFGKEPAVILGALAEVVKAIIPMLIIFGILHWTAEQVAQVMLVVGVLVGSLSIVLTRSQTTATPDVNALIRTAVKMPENATVEMVKTEQAAKDNQ